MVGIRVRPGRVGLGRLLEQRRLVAREEVELRSHEVSEPAATEHRRKTRHGGAEWRAMLTETSAFEEARAQYPVLERVAYLNAGSSGPLATATVEAMKAEEDRNLVEGRMGRPYFERSSRCEQSCARSSAASWERRPSWSR